MYVPSRQSYLLLLPRLEISHFDETCCKESRSDLGDEKGVCAMLSFYAATFIKCANVPRPSLVLRTCL